MEKEKLMTAKAFWFYKFNENPQTDSEEMAIALMEEYAYYFHMWMKEKEEK